MHSISAVYVAVAMSFLAAGFAPASAQHTIRGSSTDAFMRHTSERGDTMMVPVVPARFFVDIDGLESGFPEDQEAGGLIPRALRVRENVRMTREAIAVLQAPDGTPVKIALDSLFYVIVDELSALNFRVLSPDTLRGAVPYLLGYPMGTARSVVADGTHSRAIEIEVDVTVPDQGMGSWAVIGTGRSTTKGRPEMYLRIRYVDSRGETWRENVRVRSKQRVELSEKWLLGVPTGREVSDASSLFNMTREATQRIVKKRMDETATRDAGGG